MNRNELTNQDNDRYQQSRDQEITYRLLMNQFLAGNLQYLTTQSQLLSQALVARPKDINIMTTLQKVEHDLQILDPICRRVNSEVWEYIEAIYANGKKFKYFNQKSNA